jgi:hypothetical protein
VPGTVAALAEVPGTDQLLVPKNFLLYYHQKNRFEDGSCGGKSSI